MDAARKLAAGIMAEAALQMGEDEADLVELARREKLDLLVLGSKAKRTWRRRLGGTVEAALQRTDLPLLVVPEATVW